VVKSYKKLVFGILQIKTFSSRPTFGRKEALNHFAKSGAITSNRFSILAGV